MNTNKNLRITIYDLRASGKENAAGERPWPVLKIGFNFLPSTAGSFQTFAHE